MLTFRPIDQQEAELVSRIIQEAYAEQMVTLKINPVTFPNFVGLESPAAVLQRMEQGDQVVLAFQDSEPIGTISYRALLDNPSHGHIKRFAILPQFRGRRFGETLMSYAETGLRDIGVTQVEIALVAVFSRLRDYYVRLGYAARETKSFSTVPFEVLFMGKTLAH